MELIRPLFASLLASIAVTLISKVTAEWLNNDPNKGCMLPVLPILTGILMGLYLIESLWMIPVGIILGLLGGIIGELIFHFVGGSSQ